jgi:OOP family OmpA-OmpF porin
LALTASLWLPSATGDYAGDSVVRGGGGAVLDVSGERLYGTLNLGVRSRASEALPGLLPTRVGTGLRVGVGVGFFADAKRHVALGTELSLDLPFMDANLFDPRATVAHWLLALHYRVFGGPFELGVSVGPGLAGGAGDAAFRALGLMGYAPETPPPPSDQDEDGVPDRSDACLRLPGVPSADPLLDGCPEAPPDHDADAVPDQYDACPTLPGIATGDRRTHGCPANHDTDRDGVLDRVDACPKQAGVKPPEGNGCPLPSPEPKKPPLVELALRSIVISVQIQFETGLAVLRLESDPVLQEIARTLKEHPELLLVEVQGHTDDTGAEQKNQRLGQDRAERVVDWLVLHGVDRKRLVAKGYGSTRPLADNTDDAGRTQNRRVEFRVLRNANDANESSSGGGPR